MATKFYSGKEVKVTADGFLENAADWTASMAEEIALGEGVTLTEDHFKIISFLRGTYSAGEKISIIRVHRSGIVSLKEFYSLFPGAALRKAAKIAGIPKPENCI